MGRKIKLNGNLPEFLFDFKEGFYECEVDGYCVRETRYGTKLVVQIRIIEDEGHNILVDKYYDYNGEAVLMNSPLAVFLDSLGLIRKKKILWEDLIGQRVEAEIVINKKGNLYVNSMVPIPDSDGEIEFDEDDEEIEFDEDYEEDEEDYEE